MKSIITKGLEPDVAKEIRGDFKSSLLLRKRIITLLEEKIDNARKGLRQKENYSSPSWAFLQADGVGYERALYEVISLISDEINEI